MVNRFHITVALVGALGLVSACAQQEEVTMVKPQPTFDKFGNGSCEEGLIYVPGAAPIDPCIPEDECEPVYDAAGNIIDCLPPRTSVQEDGDGSGRTAAGGPRT